MATGTVRLLQVEAKRVPRGEQPCVQFEHGGWEKVVDVRVSKSIDGDRKTVDYTFTLTLIETHV